MIAQLWKYRYLLAQLVRRDLSLRYRGAYLGAAWALLSPLVMLAIFATVFDLILQVRWPSVPGSLPPWASMYCGLLIFNLFSETVAYAPAAVRSQPSYVKKIVFPLHILPVVPLGAGLAQALVNASLLVLALALAGRFSAGALLLPLLILPALLLALGVAWGVSALGVFAKDIAHLVPPGLQVLMFLSPVLYPAAAVPGLLRPAFDYNPIGIVMEAGRASIVGHAVNWSGWCMALLISSAVCIAGYRFFQHVREEFADVL
jgi:lipopolysaccharide transport system permease protein